ncbi:MAG: class I SAM-dependent methyltransferase [bacterium]|nr:class I SAM-dependent methyltransferase [bacterium]
MAQDILSYFGSSHSDFLHAYGAKSTAFLIEQIECKPNHVVLEIGFGTGSTLVELASRFPQSRLFGLEQSPVMFETAKQRLIACELTEYVSLHLMYEDTTPFSENQFDTIYLESVLAIQSEEELKNLLGNIQFWLKPGGKLVCNETVWLPHVTRDQIHQINEKCKQRFGIIQASEEFPYAQNWIDLFESFELTTIQSKAFSEISVPAPFKQNPKSKNFTRKGKLRSGLNVNKRKEWTTYKQSMNEIVPKGTPLMEGWFFALVNTKK